MTVLQADKVLDCSGLSCPLPVVKTSKAIKELEIGQVLKMVSTDPGSVNDMQAWARQTSNTLLDHHQEGNSFIYYFWRDA